MISLTLSAGLAAMLPVGACLDGARGGRTVTIQAENWPEAIAEIKRCYQRLADHVFDEAGALRPGLLLSINDQTIVRPGRVPASVKSGDELLMITQIAGG